MGTVPKSDHSRTLCLTTDMTVGSLANLAQSKPFGKRSQGVRGGLKRGEAEIWFLRRLIKKLIFLLLNNKNIRGITYTRGRGWKTRFQLFLKIRPPERLLIVHKSFLLCLFDCGQGFDSLTLGVRLQ